jgi:hypothetical protein
MYGGMGGMMPGYGGGMMPGMGYGGMMPGMGYGGMMPGMGYGGMMPYGGVSSRPLTTRRLYCTSPQRLTPSRCLVSSPFS